MASIINTGLSALSAFKRQMETTGHNIANVNTEGYSRQRVDLSARVPQATPPGFIGSGVELVAPVDVGAGATIGAGSTITKPAPGDKLTLERARQLTVKGWKRPAKKS